MIDVKKSAHIKNIYTIGSKIYGSRANFEAALSPHHPDTIRKWANQTKKPDHSQLITLQHVLDITIIVD